MSQNKSIVAQNQNFIPSSEGIGPDEVGNMASRIKTKNQNMVAKSEQSRTSETGFKDQGNAGMDAAEQGIRNKN